MSSENEEINEKHFTDAVKTNDYKDSKQDPFESTNQAPAVEEQEDPVDAILGGNISGRSPETKKIFAQLQDEKALAVRDIGLAKEISILGKKYTRNVITAGIRDEWVKAEEVLANARFSSNFRAVEWKVIKKKLKLLWNIDIDPNMDTEYLYRIAEASDIVVDNRFR